MKKCLAILIALTLLITAAVVGTFTLSVSAAKSGGYTYTVKDGKATITDYNGSAKQLTIPSKLGGYSVVKIGGYAFSDCENLTSITIPNSVTEIGNAAFYECTGLTSISIPNSVTKIGSAAFYKCTSLTSITLPDQVSSIGDSAFSECTGLTSITIPNSVTTINYHAFNGCTGLTSVTVPNSVTTISFGAFEGCENLEKITLPFVGKQLNSSIDSHFGRIFGADYFEDNFWYIPYSLKTVVITGGNFIPSNAFYECSNLSITLPDTITHIGYRAFYKCNLTSITIPDSVTEISSEAFRACNKLTSVTLGKGITKIWTGAFSKCNKLTSVTLPDGLLALENSAFSGCTKLTSIKIPSSVTEIGDAAFYGCNLKNVVYDGYYKDAKNISIGRSNGKLKSATWEYTPCDHTYTNVCDNTCNQCELPRTIEHQYKTVIKKATTTADGYTVKRCSVCGDEIDKTTFYKASKITLSKTAYAYNGKAQKPTVTVKDSKGNTLASSQYTITYASGRKNVGSYKVTVKFKGKYSGSKVLTFTIQPTTKSEMTILLGKTGKIGAKSNKTITYTSSNKKIATVTTKGVITAVKAGTAYITMKSGTVTQKIKVVVENPTVTITAKATSVNRNKKLQLTANSNVPDAKYTWSVSNKKIAKISSKGVVTGLKKGTVTVTAKITYLGKTYKATYKVTVNTAKPSVEIVPKSGNEYFSSLVKFKFWNYGNKSLTLLARGSIKNYISNASITDLYMSGKNRSEFVAPKEGGLDIQVRIKTKEDKAKEMWVTKDTTYVIYFEYDGEVYSATYNPKNKKTTVKHYPNG